MKRLKYSSYAIVMQEVPNEVSLAINISGCPYRCKGCHSKHLWKYEGQYLVDDIETLLNQYDGLITCVCFMGGDQNEEELLTCLNKVKERQIKTCLYTGKDSINLIQNLVKEKLDYIKIGRYIEECGALDKETTNQKMYDLKNDKEFFFYKREEIYGKDNDD